MATDTKTRDQNPRTRPKADLREVAMESPKKLELDDGGGDADRGGPQDKRQRKSSIPGPVEFVRTLGSTISGTAKGGSSYAGRGMLEAELVIAIIIIAIRIVGDYEPSPEGLAYKGTVVPSGGGLGPLSIFAAMLVTFIVLSVIERRGGTSAKLAVIFGAIVVLSLAMKSWSQIAAVAGDVTRTTAATTLTADNAGNTFDTTANLAYEEFGSGGGPTMSQSNIQVTGLTTADNSTTGTNISPALGTQPNIFTQPSNGTTVPAGDASGLFPVILPGQSGIQGNVPGVSAPGAPGFPGLGNGNGNLSPNPEPAPGG